MKNISSQSGFSLVSILIAVGIIGVIAAAVSQNFVNVNEHLFRLDQKLERLALNRFLIEAVDCTLTAADAPSPCGDGTYVNVKSQAPTNPIIVKKYSDANPADVSAVGAYEVRAKCGPSQTLVFEARRSKSRGSQYQPVFPDVPFGCVMP